MELNSQRTGLGHQHGRRSIVLGHQYGPRDVMCKHSISLHILVGHVVKGPRHVMAFSLILLILSVTLPYALWSLTLTKKLLANDKIKASCSTNTLPKHYIKRYKQQK